VSFTDQYKASLKGTLEMVRAHFIRVVLEYDVIIGMLLSLGVRSD
jgi:hypothetical protein